MEALIGRKSILNARTVIEEFREQQGRGSEVLTSVDWFLSKRVVWNEIPVILLSRIEGSLQGMVLLYYSTACWLPYGLARGGRRGDVSVIAPAAQQRQLLETAAQFLVRYVFAHTVILTVPYRVPTASRDRVGHHSALCWVAREDAHRLDLSGGWDATMKRLSYKLRRNLRSYRRRAESKGTVRFMPDLTMAQRHDAIAALSDKGRYPTALPQARKWDGALRDIPGAFAMGLQSARGDWLSYVVGWREPSATYIDWQLNDENESASTVMRSYLIEHETERKSPALVFVGGTSAIWQRACDPALASDLLVIGTGSVARILRSAFHQFKPNSDVTLLYKRTSLAAQENSDGMGLRAQG